jgi:putative RecB family exonuclease
MALPLPRSLSPSKVSKFTSCPLAFRYAHIDRYPEPPSVPMVKGTLVHAALEGLVWNHPPGRRSLDAALGELSQAWDTLRDDPSSEYAALELTDDGAAAFIDDARKLVHNYFALEDPNQVRSVGVELGLEADIGGVRVRGIIDRLDLTEDGRLVVIDYKTGRAPGEGFERGKLVGVQVYALLCEQVLGVAPSEVRLLHLREPVSIVAVPTEQSIRGQRQRAGAIWKAIDRACAAEDFRPRPSGLCGHCHFRSMCPAVGGEVPTRAPVALAS